MRRLDGMISRELDIRDLPIHGAFEITPKEFRDERGSFLKFYDRKLLASKNIHLPLFVEEYLSVSAKGVVRGLHYQLPPFQQSKLVRCIRGAVFDVIVDLKQSSKTFRHWYSMVLSEKNKESIFVPRTCAHGFLSLESNSTVSYVADNDYAPEQERGIIWNDKSLGITWPQMPAYIVSKKDASWPIFDEVEKFA